MNRYPNLDNKLKYDFLLNIVRASKRPYSKWYKKAKSVDLDVIKEYYGYSDAKAYEALKILSDDQIAIIKKELYKG
jgi:ribosomal protein S18 acetylase RimI-like enzyme